METKIKGISDVSKVVFREALASDHEDVKVMCRGALGGRDVLPARFLQYLRDPLRRFLVAVYDGKVVAIAAGRIVDGGNVVEGHSGRAVPHITGVFSFTRKLLTERWMMQEHPHIKIVRGTVRSEKAIRERATANVLPGSIRVIIDLAWKVPLTSTIRAMDIYERNHLSRMESQVSIIRADRTGVTRVFEDKVFQKKYIPCGVVVVDSSPLGLNYKDNVDLIVNEDHNLFISHNDGNLLMAVSFGTGVEMDVTMETMRYVIDYYGVTDLNTLIVHTMKHIFMIPALIEKSSTAKNVYVAVFLLENQFEHSFVHDFQQFMSSELLLGDGHSNIQTGRQFIVDIEIPIKESRKHRL